MLIGTALSPSATSVMLLGSGELGKEVIIALQRFGVETIAVDRYPNAPGHQVAHRAHVINMTDGTALRVPQSDLRLFGKPESFAKRRMGMALANDRDINKGRARAKLAASKIRPLSSRKS